MKVGIVSMQRVINYGSFLQAYSLKNTIEKMGNECVFLDIENEKGNFDYADIYTAKGYWVRSLYRKLTQPITNRLFQEREYLFKKKLLPLLGMKNTYSKATDCDAVVFGSDEIFNCCQDSPWGKTTNLLGKNIETSILISYAASFGFTTAELLQQNNMFDEASECLNRFDDISVRDLNSFKIAKQMTGKDPVKHLDPVLIFDYPERLKYKPKFKNYIVIYGYDNRICEPEIIEKIQDFAKKNHLKTVALGMQQDWCDINYLPHPFELLSLIENADFVITDTFHGTVFSIKYQKQFATIIRDSNQQKLSDLLNTFGLSGRRITQADQFDEVLLQTYDKEAVRSTLKSGKNNTIMYLQRWLKK